MLLPFFWPAQITQIGEEQVDLEVEIRVQVVRFHVELSSEEHNVIDFYLLFAISDQRSGVGNHSRKLPHRTRNRHSTVCVPHVLPPGVE